MSWSKIVLYYSKEGKEQEEFQYLIDYLFHYQLINNASRIQIRLANAEKYAFTNFVSAIDEYKNRFEKEDEVFQKLDDIEFESITTITKKFSEMEIGMESK